jgi:LuxR family maltose regulon positive regulatory protein
MQAMLGLAASRGIALDYANKLLAAFGEATSPSALLVEPLSGRELEVLRLLTTRLSSTEIARQLVISVHTVRSHVKNIYGKLNVHSRANAVRRAKELGLL